MGLQKRLGGSAVRSWFYKHSLVMVFVLCLCGFIAAPILLKPRWPEAASYFQELAKYVVPLFSPVLLWWLNEQAKREQEHRLRLEQRYLELVTTVQGFGEKTQSGEKERLLQEFCDESRKAQLYCSDAVIKALNRFLKAVAATDLPQEERDRRFRELMLVLRKDALRLFRPGEKTRLEPEDFDLWVPTPPGTEERRHDVK